MRNTQRVSKIQAPRNPAYMFILCLGLQCGFEIWMLDLVPLVKLTFTQVLE